jgi:hypothetical protein
MQISDQKEYVFPKIALKKIITKNSFKKFQVLRKKRFRSNIFWCIIFCNSLQIRTSKHSGFLKYQYGPTLRTNIYRPCA